VIYLIKIVIKLNDYINLRVRLIVSIHTKASEIMM